MTQEEIQDLIKFVAKSGVNEVEIERKDFKITIKSPGNGNKRGKARSSGAPHCANGHARWNGDAHADARSHAAAPAPAPAACSLRCPCARRHLLNCRCWLDRNQEPDDRDVLPQAFP